MDPLTQALRAIADPRRRTILDLLQDGGRSVTDLAAGFDMGRPAVSKHLATLREAGLVKAHAEGRQQIYELDPRPLGTVREWLGHHEGGAAVSGESPKVTKKSASRTRKSARAKSTGREPWRCW